LLKLLKRIWNDSVWRKVIAQGIIEFIRNNIWPVGVTISSIVVSYFAGWWPKIISLALSEIRIKIWQLIILCLFTLWKLAGLLLKLKQKSDAWKYYKKDTIDGIVWRWDYYISGNLDKESICGYCPCCDRDITFSGFGGLISEPVTYNGPRKLDHGIS
jgi:hypothetical protein